MLGSRTEGIQPWNDIIKKGQRKKIVKSAVAILFGFMRGYYTLTSSICTQVIDTLMKKRSKFGNREECRGG